MPDKTKTLSFRVYTLLLRGLTSFFPWEKRKPLIAKFHKLYFRTKYVETRRSDGRAVCLSLQETDKLLYGADHKRFNKNNFYPVMQSLIKPGSIVIDVGASYGDEVIEMSDLVGPNGTVYAIEPNPIAFPALQRTVALNGLKNVVCINKAVGTKNGYVDFDNSREIVSNNYAPPGQDNAIACISLDSLWEEEISPKKVSLIKIDTDGFEIEVLKGAEDILSHNTDCEIISEYLPHLDYSGFKGKDTLHQFQKMGLGIHKIQMAAVPIDEHDFDELINEMDNPLFMISHDLVLKKIKN